MELSVADLSLLLSTLGEFTWEEVLQFKREATVRRFRMGDYVLEVGEICRSTFWVISGTACQIFTLEGLEMINARYVKGDWCCCYASFISARPSRTAIRASTDVVALELTTGAIRRLIGCSPAFCQLGRLLEKVNPL